MTRWKQRAYKLRHLLLSLAIITFLAAFYLSLIHPLLVWSEIETPVVFTPIFTLISFLIDSTKITSLEKLYFTAYILFIWALIIFFQWLYLAPRKNFIQTTTTPARPMKRAMIVAAFMSTLLSLGLIFIILELFTVYIDFGWLAALIITAAMLLIWSIWSFIFYQFWRANDQYTQLTKMTRALFVGSSLEAVIAAAVYAANPHKMDCYCARGSYLSLIYSLTVIFWSFGPGLYFLYLYQKRRQHLITYRITCPDCGYNLHGSTSSTCPECGCDLSAK
ncbi:hypothetical protein KS4_18600 [Poriferisphaera corsica]|uniref:Uncharacterized protein n=1 Tax=Poriferisphaera corsica TaxID=2528020 RepID=A0A517YUF2_9BACT|nr:phage holin family protein [Poriferisphaera corsica]QDU33802.1 hypothetical protein KS4_18600 [Poriferisphaera corsica]